MCIHSHLLVLLLANFCNAQVQQQSGVLFANPAAFLIGGAFITVSFFFWMCIYCCCSGGGKRIDQIFDGCTSSTAYYKYMIKMQFGPHSAGYTSKSTTVMIDLIDDSRMFITRIAIPAPWMSHRKAVLTPSKTIKKLWVTKFQLNRGTPMSDTAFIRISHDCFQTEKQTLKVYSLEIKDLMANTLTYIPIYSDIGTIGPDSDTFEQNFRAMAPTQVKQDEDDMYLEGITPYVSLPEFSVFVIFYIGLSIVLTLFIPYALHIDDLIRGIINGLTVSAINIVTTAIVIITYKRGIKRGYATNHGTGAWGCIRYMFLFLIIFLALAFSVTGSVIASSLDPSQVVNWCAAICVTIIMMVVIYAPFCIVVSKKLGFIEGGKAKQKTSKSNEPKMQRPLELGVGPSKTSKTAKTISTPATTSAATTTKSSILSSPSVLSTSKKS